MTADKNNDGNTWTFYKPTQTTTYDRCDQNADDWLYTPALKFEKCKTYQVRYTYSSANWVTPDKHEQVMEQMKVWFCAEPIVTGAAKLIKETGEFHTASNIFLYGRDNFQTETTGSARIGIKNTTHTDMLDEDGGNAMLDEDGFTTVFDGNITIQGNANDLELVVNLDKPYRYDGGNVIMKFECPLGTQYIKDSTKHPDWHMMEMDGNPHIAYCSGEDEDANVWGELLMPFISIAYKDNGSTGIFAIGGDKNGVTRSGDSLLFDECADEARLYSATGALVANAQRANALSVAGLAKGIYVLKLTKGGAVRSLKVEF